MKAWRRASAVVVGAALLSASACGGSGRDFLANEDAGLYVEVPQGWTRFRIDTTAGRTDPAIPVQPWRIVLDRSPNPSPDNFDEYSGMPTDTPVALVEVVPLTGGSIRQEIDLTYLRSLALSPEGAAETDPLRIVQEGRDLVEIIDYVEMHEGDLFGARIVLNLRLDQAAPQAPAGTFMTRAHVAMVDSHLTRLYRLVVLCEASCFERYRADIDKLLDTWTVEPGRR